MPELAGSGPAAMTSNPASESDLVFGPVPSRRLGRSLGINAIPARMCSYACVYCQAGKTTQLTIRRRAFATPDAIARQVGARLAQAQRLGPPPEVITFVPDGEATLERELEAAIVGLRRFGLPIAVLTNASLIDDPQVTDALRAADIVSLKVDAVDEGIWRAVNRPHGSLSLAHQLQAALAFAGAFSGRLLTETLLVKGLNDGADHLQALAGFLALLGPEIAYLSAPIRPPAEPWVRPPLLSQLVQAHQILAARLPRVEYLLGDEGTDFYAGDDPIHSLLAITCVHPVRRPAALRLLQSTGDSQAALDRLVSSGQLRTVGQGGQTFYLRSVSRQVHSA